jgi:hypothetical protein
MFGHTKKFRNNNKFLFERYLILNTIFLSQTNITKNKWYFKEQKDYTLSSGQLHLMMGKTAPLSKLENRSFYSTLSIVYCNKENACGLCDENSSDDQPSHVLVVATNA